MGYLYNEDHPIIVLLLSNWCAGCQITGPKSQLFFYVVGPLFWCLIDIGNASIIETRKRLELHQGGSCHIKSTSNQHGFKGSKESS